MQTKFKFNHNMQTVASIRDFKIGFRRLGMKNKLQLRVFLALLFVSSQGWGITPRLCTCHGPPGMCCT